MKEGRRKEGEREEKRKGEIGKGVKRDKHRFKKPQ